MSKSLRWGIIAPGRLAPRLGRAIRGSRRGELVAVASRDLYRAAAFAARHDIPRWWDAHDALLAQFDSSLTAAILDGTPPRVDLDFSRGNCATLVGLDAAARSHALTRSG